MSKKFLNAVLSDVFDMANDPETGGLRLTSVAGVILDRLEEAGIVSEPQVSFFRNEKGKVASEVHGWAVDIEDDLLRLFFCIDATEHVPLGDEAEPVTIPKDELERAFRKLEAFVRNTLSGQFDTVEESQPVAALVKVLQAAGPRDQTVELHIVTTGNITDRTASSLAGNGLRREVWDLTRLARVCSSGPDGSISINFVERFGRTLPCLVNAPDGDGVQVLLTMVPGQLLAGIYNDYRSALLERNVRSFLQFNGKVNRGIRDTLKTCPNRFLPYNNGLSTTASSVALREKRNGVAQIESVSDFQIVNGGQTTASIAAALRRDQVDLSHVVVPMKLTVVPADRLGDIVPSISKYANTQNRIEEADFFANNAWHIALERLSRNTWTGALPKAPRGTRWFYERSRGQYADELGSQKTPAGRMKYRTENPGSQKFTKTDLAKFWLSWDQLPHLVSLGAQKCFVKFMESVVPNRPVPDEGEFRSIIVRAILFRRAESLYGEMGLTGYRAQIVTYSIARLSHHVGKRLPVNEIWKTQAVPEELVGALRLIITGVRNILLNPPKGKNLTEWCKKESCWESVLACKFNITLEIEGPGPIASESSQSFGKVLTPEEQELVTSVQAIGSDVWISISTWAKQTGSLLPWQRGVAFSIGKLNANRTSPSIKQAKQGGILLAEAVRLGFRHDALAKDSVRVVSNLVKKF